MGLIGGSVGKDGQNAARDVKIVQRLLNKHPLPPLQKLSVDGKIGSHTISTIRHFQEVVVKMRSPDGRVDPGGRSLRRLNRGAQSAAPSGARVGSAAGAAGGANLSGSKWWRANQAKYPNSKQLDDLDGHFRGNAKRFVRALRDAGATVSINATRRDKIRAHLMHYSWQVSKGKIRAADVPAITGLQIKWDHGDEETSRKAAGQMVSKFGMAYLASLTSYHIRGKAIDMNISWKRELSIAIPGKDKPAVLRTGPRSGAKNRELHRIGRDFGVKKHPSDAPHWSLNGR